MWGWLISWLVWLSADPAVIDAERPKAAAAVAAARASLATGSPSPAPGPAPKDCVCGGTCVGGQWKPDGRVLVPCPCPASCNCKKPKAAGAAECPDGKCQGPAVLR
jgi:hypothetical protein